MHLRFKEYQRQIVRNAQALADALAGKGLEAGFRWDRQSPHAGRSHVNRASRAKDAASAPRRRRHYGNKNVIPFDQSSITPASAWARQP